MWVATGENLKTSDPGVHPDHGQCLHFPNWFRVEEHFENDRIGYGPDPAR